MPMRRRWIDEWRKCAEKIKSLSTEWWRKLKALHRYTKLLFIVFTIECVYFMLVWWAEMHVNFVRWVSVWTLSTKYIIYFYLSHLALCFYLSSPPMYVFFHAGIGAAGERACSPHSSRARWSKTAWKRGTPEGSSGMMFYFSSEIFFVSCLVCEKSFYPISGSEKNEYIAHCPTSAAEKACLRFLYVIHSLCFYFLLYTGPTGEGEGRR